MNVLWSNTKETIKEAIDKSVIRAEETVGVGVSGHGDGLCLLDENGDPIRKSVLSLDRPTWLKRCFPLSDRCHL